MDRLGLLSVFLLGACCALFAAAVLAAEWHKDKDNALLPSIPQARGEQCVEPTEVMRRRHMDFILHQRDKTVHQGVRTEKHRFVNCINCHVQPQRQAGGNLVYPRHTSADHFCTSCHVYALVSIDCFQCHADRPQSFYERAARAERAVSSLEESGMGRLKTEGASGEEAEEAYLEVGMGRLKMKGASGASP